MAGTPGYAPCGGATGSAVTARRGATSPPRNPPSSGRVSNASRPGWIGRRRSSRPARWSSPCERAQRGVSPQVVECRSRVRRGDGWGHVMEGDGADKEDSRDRVVGFRRQACRAGAAGGWLRRPLSGPEPGEGPGSGRAWLRGRPGGHFRSCVDAAALESVDMAYTGCRPSDDSSHVERDRRRYALRPGQAILAGSPLCPIPNRPGDGGIRRQRPPRLMGGGEGDIAEGGARRRQGARVAGGVRQGQPRAEALQ